MQPVIAVAEINIDESGYSLQWNNGPRQQWNICTQDDGSLREVSSGNSSRFLTELEEVTKPVLPPAPAFALEASREIASYLLRLFRTMIGEM